MTDITLGDGSLGWGQLYATQNKQPPAATRHVPQSYAVGLRVVVKRRLSHRASRYHPDDTRAIVRIPIKNAQGQILGGYSDSHALLVGVSKYTAGWPKLESIPAELDRISEALGAQGFKIERLIDPTGDQLAFVQFSC